MQAITTLLAPFYGVLGPLLATAIAGMVLKLGAKVHAWLTLHSKVAALAVITDAVDTALQAAVKAAGGSLPPTPATYASALAAAKASIVAAFPDIETALDQELDTVLAPLMASAAGLSAAPAAAAAAAK
jgi:hypothetical protein